MAAGRFAQDAAGDTARQFLAHQCEREPNAIPSEIPQAAEGLERAVPTDVLREEIFPSQKAESRCDSFDASHTALVLEHAPQPFQAAAVHEHHAIHELDFAVAANREHFTEICHAGSAGLFADNVFARFGAADDPFLANTCGQRDIDRVNVPGGDQFLVTGQRLRRRFHRCFGLALIDKCAAAFKVAAGHGDDRGVAAVADRLPVFARDIRRPQNSPAEFVIFIHFRGALEHAELDGVRRYKIK